MNQYKTLAMLVIGLWYILLGIVFFIVRPELAYSYGHWLHGFSNNLPQITASLSLPILGPAFSSTIQTYSTLFWLAWGLLSLPPLLLLYFVWRSNDSQWVVAGTLWSGVYLLLTAILLIFVAFGLWLPFSVA